MKGGVSAIMYYSTRIDNIKILVQLVLSNSIEKCVPIQVTKSLIQGYYFLIVQKFCDIDIATFCVKIKVL